MRSTTPSITDLPPSPGDEERSRTRQYLIVMAIRLACMFIAIAIAALAPGWWIVIPIAGAVFLPLFAVVAANAPRVVRGTVERPGPRELPGSAGTGGPSDPAGGRDDAAGR
ncbi:MAG: DUF3099 domain-containing protein [Actinomycetales bacterium]|nr:DUF3099 domain-containing protein [Actinomycetales bacterium]